MRTRSYGWTLAAIVTGILAGCAADGEQNYRELERDPAHFTDDPDEVLGDSALPQPLEELQAQASTQPTDDTPGVTVLYRDSPSVLAIDQRDNWPVVTVGPARAEVTHGPRYYHTPGLDGWVDVLEPESVPERLDLALAGAESEVWTGEDAVAAVWAPGRFLLDTVLLPVRMIQQPPWQTVVSP